MGRNPNPTWQKNVYFHPVHGCQPLQSSCAAAPFEEIQISPTIPYDLALEELEIHGIDKSDNEHVIQWDPYMNMSEDETHEEEEQKECHVTVTVDAVPHTYGQLRVHHDISLGPLLQIWGARFIPQLNKMQQKEDAMTTTKRSMIWYLFHTLSQLPIAGTCHR